MDGPLTRHLICLLLLACLVTAAAGPSPAAARVHEPGLSTLWPIDLTGTVEVEGPADTVFLRGIDTVARTHIRAEEIRIKMTWERGFNAAEITQVVTADGVDEIEIADADVRFEPSQGEPRFLAYRTSEAMAAHTTLTHTASLIPGTEEKLVGVGASPSATGSSEGRSPSFWYSTAAPTIEVQGGGTVVAEGSFTVFVHDVRIYATGTEAAWSNWTGYRKADATAPAGEYEFRVTTIEVTNGTFVSGAPEEVRLFLPDLTAAVDGSVTTFDVIGQLEHGNKRHIFSKDPLQLHGRGTLTVTSALPVELGRGTSADRTALALTPTGSFELTGAGQVEVLPGDEEPAPGGPLAAGGFGAVALLATLGLMVLGIVPAPTSRSRQHQSALWQRRGRAALDAGHWTRATKCFMLATRFKHDDPLAWYEWAHAELEAGHPEQAESVAVRAAEVPGIDPLDLLDLRASAAWQRGDQEAFQLHLQALADLAPEMADGLVTDLGVDPTSLSFNRPRTKEDIDGYA